MLDMLKTRIQMACEMTLLPIEEIAHKASLTPERLSALIDGTETPFQMELLNLSKVCDVYPEYFFRNYETFLEDVKYRVSSVLGEEQKKALGNIVLNLGENFSEIQNWSKEPILAEFSPSSNLPAEISNLEDIEDFVELFRKEKDMGLGRIFSVRQSLAGIGILVVEVKKDIQGFMGLKGFFCEKDKNSFSCPVIAVSKNLSPGEKRFTIAHEVGHLILNGRLAAHIDEEKACDRFAAAFLAPKMLVIKTIGTNRKAISYPEFEILIKTFGLPLIKCLERLRDCKIIPEKEFSRLGHLFSQKKNKALVDELNNLAHEEETFLNEKFIWRAFTEGLISERKAATVLGIYLDELYDREKILCEIHY